VSDREVDIGRLVEIFAEAVAEGNFRRAELAVEAAVRAHFSERARP
jgi:hypothetical protein